MNGMMSYFMEYYMRNGVREKIVIYNNYLKRQNDIRK